MNKKIFGRKLSRNRSSREALFSTLVSSMFLSGKMVTTRAKGKAVQGEIERLITLAKKGGLSARRQVLSKLDNSRKATDILFNKIAGSFSAKKSGFVKLVPQPSRKGDNAQMVKLEWTEKVDMTPVKVVKEKKEKKEKVEEKKVKAEKKSSK